MDSDVKDTKGTKRGFFSALLLFKYLAFSPDKLYSRYEVAGGVHEVEQGQFV